MVTDADACVPKGHSYPDRAVHTLVIVAKHHACESGHAQSAAVQLQATIMSCLAAGELCTCEGLLVDSAAVAPAGRLSFA